MRRIPELDALRGCAAVGIMLFHFTDHTLFGRFAGYLGRTSLELFFVLSGFLITSIVLEYSGKKHFLRNFYMRRGLRIWPLYYALIALALFICLLRPRTFDLDGLLNYLTYTQHVTEYWGQPQKPFVNGFMVTWSLAIEEQFYLLWPPLILLLGGRAIPVLTVAAIASSLAMRHAGFSEKLLLARCDGFALGGLLAWSVGDWNSLARRVKLLHKSFVVTGGIACLYLLLFQPIFLRERPFDIAADLGYPTITFIALFYFAFVGLAVIHSGHKILIPLRNRFLRYLGTISYSLYLFHMFALIYVIILVQRYTNLAWKLPWLITVASFAATFVASSLSWRFFEEPILRLKDRWFRYDRGLKKDLGGVEIVAATEKVSWTRPKELQFEGTSDE